MKPVCRTVSVHKNGLFRLWRGYPFPLFIYATYKRKRVLACFCTFCFVLGAVFWQPGGLFLRVWLGKRDVSEASVE